MNGADIHLDNRLALCAEFVRDGTRLVDVGTDHAYLPVWLALRGRIESAVACDIRTGPLKNAENNIKRFGAQATVKTRLSDGLDSIDKNDAYDIVIAGMGGELIAEIIKRTQWLCTGERRLILQPMTRAESLRLFLCKNGFQIVDERACVSGRKVYSVMACEYDGIIRKCEGVYRFVGRLAEDDSAEAKEYILNINTKLKKRILGLSTDSDDHSELDSIIKKLDGLLE